MENSGALTFWSADALISLTRGQSYNWLTPELISRLSAFVEGFILFDKIRLPERYSKYDELKELGGENSFLFTPAKDVLHSDDLTKGITIDVNLALAAFSDIANEDAYWTIQHDPDLYEEMRSQTSEIANSRTMSLMRIWLSSATNEISEKYGSTLLLPNSLASIEKYTKINSQNTDYIHEKYSEFSKYYQGQLISASRSVEDPYIDTIKNFPPLLACLLDRAKNSEHILDTLNSMRKEYSELRDLRKNFTSSISNTNTVGQKREIIEAWNTSWEHLLKSDFKRTGFLSRKISSGDIVKMVFNPNNYIEILKFLAQQSVDHFDEGKRTKQFKIFCRIAADSSAVLFNNQTLLKKFGIQGVAHST
ncbi:MULTISPECIES: hypothetical protein [unclassified Pseudomonas]|jgi:hypothetical protein|uniref:hypothetical protein n=1 Tax=unclassified Pseudomonas TaxID=196821 RepID=UPI0011BE5439|nr:hypothetical protein [Pseudomonas sp. MWU12-2020]